MSKKHLVVFPVSCRHTKQERRWRIRTILKFFTISWSIFKALGKGLEGFIDKSNARKAAFGMHFIEKFPGNPNYKPLSWFIIRPLRLQLTCSVNGQFVYMTDGLVIMSLATIKIIHDSTLITLL